MSCSKAFSSEHTRRNCRNIYRDNTRDGSLAHITRQIGTAGPENSAHPSSCPPSAPVHDFGQLIAARLEMPAESVTRERLQGRIA